MSGKICYPYMVQFVRSVARADNDISICQRFYKRTGTTFYFKNNNRMRPHILIGRKQVIFWVINHCIANKYIFFISLLTNGVYALGYHIFQYVSQ